MKVAHPLFVNIAYQKTNGDNVGTAGWARTARTSERCHMVSPT